MHFRQLEEGEDIPEYKFVFEKHQGPDKKIDANGQTYWDAIAILKEVKEIIYESPVVK